MSPIDHIGHIQAIMMEEHPEDLDDEAEEGEGEEEEEEESIPDPQALTPEEMCRRPEGTIVFADVNLRSDTAVDSLLFHQVSCYASTFSVCIRHACSGPDTYTMWQPAYGAAR
jgi:hypothetical protein